MREYLSISVLRVLAACLVCGLLLAGMPASASPTARCQVQFKGAAAAVRCTPDGLVTVWADSSIKLRSLVNATSAKVRCGAAESLLELCSKTASIVVERSSITGVKGDSSAVLKAIAVPEGFTSLYTDLQANQLKKLMYDRLFTPVPTLAAISVISRFSVAWQSNRVSALLDIPGVHITARSILIANSTFSGTNSGTCLRLNASHTIGATVTVRDSHFSGCVAPLGSYPIIPPSQGGALYVNLNHTTAARVFISGNTSFTSCQASEGGALYVEGSNTTHPLVRFTGTTAFIGNAATSVQVPAANGGAAYFHFGAEYYLAIGYVGGFMEYISLKNKDAHYTNVSIEFLGTALFHHNLAQRDGGAVVFRCVLSSGVNVTMSPGVSFVDNTALYGRGGAFYHDLFLGAGHVSVNGVQFVGNQAGVDGGAVITLLVYSSATSLTFRDCLFQDNKANLGSGGGINMDVGYSADVEQGQVVFLKGSKFVNNSAANSVGGGVFITGRAQSCSDLTWWFDCSTAVEGLTPYIRFQAILQDCQFANNSATFGGALFTYSAVVLVKSTTFLGNNATTYGGAVYTKAMLRFSMINITATGNSAGQQGGAVYSSINDIITWHLVDIIDCTLANNSAGTQGGGLYMLGGLADIQGTRIVSNTAGQQGGGIAYASICSSPGTCALVLHLQDNATYTRPNVVANNSAFTGGGVFISNNATNVKADSELRVMDYLHYRNSLLPVFNTTQLTMQVFNNSAVYAPDISLAPFNLKLDQARFRVASSTDDSGLVPLVVQVGRPSIRVQVDWCSMEVHGRGSIVGNVVKSDANGTAMFNSLRLLNTEGEQEYCLQVSTTDYPDVPAAQFHVYIRNCIAGEFLDAGVGCTLCPPNQYSFSPRSGCHQCPPHANCTGGSVFLPDPGFWHSSPNTSTLGPCPNPAACHGSREALHRCQSRPQGAAPQCRTPQGYKGLQCTRGYTGNLCGSCDRARGYGMLSFFRCGKCMHKAASAVVLALAALVAIGILVFIALRAMMDSQLAAVPQESISGVNVTTNNEDLYGAFKVLILHMQYLGIIGQLLVDWPKAVRVLRQGIYFMFGTSGPQVVSWDCLGVHSNALKMLLQLLLPVLVVCAAALFICLWVLRKWSLARRSITSLDAWIVCAIIGTYFFYTQMVTTSLSAFSCMPYGPHSYWVRDMDTECWTPAHIRASVPIGLIGSLLLCVAAPACTIHWLMSNWKVLNTHDFKRRYAFLYRAYRQRYCFWEGVMCLFTVGLVSVQLFARRHGAYYQLILLMLLLGTMNSLMQSLRPFQSPRLHRLFITGNVTLLLTCCAVLALMKGQTASTAQSSESVRTAAAFLMILINCAFIALCLFMMARAVLKILQNFTILTNKPLHHHALLLLPKRMRRFFTPADAAARPNGAPAPASAIAKDVDAKPVAAPATADVQQQQQQQPEVIQDVGVAVTDKPGYLHLSEQPSTGGQSSLPSSVPSFMTTGSKGLDDGWPVSPGDGSLASG